MDDWMGFYGELQHRDGKFLHQLLVAMHSHASPACNDCKSPGHGETLGHPGCRVRCCKVWVTTIGVKGEMLIDSQIFSLKFPGNAGWELKYAWHALVSLQLELINPNGGWARTAKQNSCHGRPRCRLWRVSGVEEACSQVAARNAFAVEHPWWTRWSSNLFLGVNFFKVLHFTSEFR